MCIYCIPRHKNHANILCHITFHHIRAQFATLYPNKHKEQWNQSIKRTMATIVIFYHTPLYHFPTSTQSTLDSVITCRLLAEDDIVCAGTWCGCYHLSPFSLISPLNWPTLFARRLDFCDLSCWAAKPGVLLLTTTALFVNVELGRIGKRYQVTFVDIYNDL